MTSREHKFSFIISFFLFTPVLLSVFGQTGYMAIQAVYGIPSSTRSIGWVLTTIFNASITALWWSIVWPIWVQFQTRLMVDGITQPRFWGQRRIHWHEISSVALDGLILIVSSAHERIEIKSSFAALALVLTTFRQYLPAEMVPSMPVFPTE